MKPDIKKFPDKTSNSAYFDAPYRLLGPSKPNLTLWPFCLISSLLLNVVVTEFDPQNDADGDSFVVVYIPWFEHV